MGKVRKLLLAICLIVFLVSAGMLIKYFWTGHMVQKDFEELEKEYTLAELYDKNKDTFGKIKIEDTKLSYPVMYTPDDPEHYLRKNFEGEHSEAGTPFLDGHTDVDNSLNWIIYGHHMKDGTMFKTLVNYDKDGYYEKHPTITLETLKYGKQTYKIFAFGKTTADAEDFNVYHYINITDRSEYNTYVKGLKALSQYDTGITPQYGDRIITLSTCSYHTGDDGGRYVVAAVLVDGDSTDSSGDSNE